MGVAELVIMGVVELVISLLFMALHFTNSSPGSRDQTVDVRQRSYR